MTVVFIILVILIGLRDEVGGDWFVYLRMFRFASAADLKHAIESTDPAYGLLNWAVGKLGLGFWAVNLFCAGVFTTGLIALARRQPNPELAILVGVPYLIIVVAMGYTRQSVALGFLMLAFTQYTSGSTLKALISLSAAAVFHKSAVIAVPLILLTSIGESGTAFIGLFTVCAITYSMLLSSSTANLMASYIERGMTSSGAGVRVAMNALAGGVFLVVRKRFGFDGRAKKLWTVFSLAALATVPLFLLSPSSTAVDRSGIYLIPLQIVVFSRLPFVVSPQRQSLPLLTLVVAYSLSVEATWLLLGQTSWAWIPYRNFLWLPEHYAQRYHPR